MIASSPSPPPTAMPMMAANERLEEDILIGLVDPDELSSVDADPEAVTTSVVVAKGLLKEERVADTPTDGMSASRVMPAWL